VELAFTVKDDPDQIRAVFSVAGGVAHKDKPETLRVALLKLPEDRRELVVFSQYQQLTAEEIAELFDMDVTAAKVSVHRAMLELRDLYRTLSG